MTIFQKSQVNLVFIYITVNPNRLRMNMGRYQVVIYQSEVLQKAALPVKQWSLCISLYLARMSLSVFYHSYDTGPISKDGWGSSIGANLDLTNSQALLCSHAQSHENFKFKTQTSNGNQFISISSLNVATTFLQFTTWPVQ